MLNLAVGPVEYDATPGTFSPQSQPIYKTAADFGTWCRAVAVHESATFPTVKRYSLPMNEINASANAALFPGGNAQIAQYSAACYAAIKAAQPNSFIYGFALDMDPSSDPLQFVAAMVALGCKVGTCYDGLAIHLSLSYPIPSAGVPCFPLASIDCVKAVQGAAGAQVHIIIGESAYYVPNSVPDEATKATATVAEMSTFSDYSSIDGALYGNVDECGLYIGTYFEGGCLIDESGTALPAYTALASLAAQYF